jgi:hypothetical protein
VDAEVDYLRRTSQRTVARQGFCRYGKSSTVLLLSPCRIGAPKHH